MCYGFEDQVWSMGITFSHRLGTAGLFTFMDMQRTLPGQARARSFSIKFEGFLASSLRRKKMKQKKKCWEAGRREKVKN